MSYELKPCPRCHGADVIMFFWLHKGYEPICNKCGLSGLAFSVKTEAAEWWNARAEDPVKAELLEALQELVVDCDQVSGLMDYGYLEFNLDKAMAAIAKAIKNEVDI